MSSLILCRKQKATQPYKLPHIRYKLYTIEELAFCIFDNLYLIDHSLMSESFCKWLEKELGMFALADNLREKIIKRVPLEEFILYFLQETHIYSTTELNNIQSVLITLEGQEETEKQKRKADDLLAMGEYENAILAYKSILDAQRTEDLDPDFYAKVYACLGSAYGKLFLYREAARAYSSAYQISDNYDMARAYIYSCRQYMTAEEYHLLLAERDIYKLADKENASLITGVENEVGETVDEKMIEQWKVDFREMPI